MMVDSGVMESGTTEAPQQTGTNLDSTQEGGTASSVHSDDDTVRCVMKEVDLNAAALRALKHYSGLLEYPRVPNDRIPLRFSLSMHGRRACVKKDGLTALRIDPSQEFHDAKVFSNRPLRQFELFEVKIDSTEGFWHGNITIGLMSLCARGNVLEAKEIVMMCGSKVFRNGKETCLNAPIDLETLEPGAKVGIMRVGSFVHFFLNDLDRGPISQFHMPTAWAVVDLYGKCIQVTVCQPNVFENRPSDLQPHRWHYVSGSVSLEECETVALRSDVLPAPLSHGLAFSEHPLRLGDRFEMEVICHYARFAGALRVGVTDLDLLDNFTRQTTLYTKGPSIDRIPANVWYISGNVMYHNGDIIDQTTTSLELLRESNCISLELMLNGTLKVLLNSTDIDAHFYNIPKRVHVVIELKGTTMAVQLISFHKTAAGQEAAKNEEFVSEAPTYKFSPHCGKNIRLSDDRRTAMRTESYSHGVIFVSRALSKEEGVSVRVDAINPHWKGTICVGVVDACPLGPNELSTVMYTKRGCWLAAHDVLNINGELIPSRYGKAFGDIKVGSTIAVSISLAGKIVISVDSISLGELPGDPPGVVFPVFDLFGKCEQISLS